MTIEEISVHLHKIEMQLEKLTVLVETEIDHIHKGFEDIKGDVDEIRHTLYGHAGDNGLRSRLVKLENHISIMKWYVRSAVAAIGGLILQQLAMRFLL